jgi:hypothetical protein
MERDYVTSLMKAPTVTVRVRRGQTVTYKDRIHTAGQHIRLHRAHAARLEADDLVERVR